MGNVFWADPNQIRNSATRFQDVADTARRIDEDTTNGLGLLTPIGGGDDFGKQFDDRFYKAYDAASGVVRGTGDGLDKTKTQLDTTADFYEKADEINRQLPPHLV